MSFVKKLFSSICQTARSQPEQIAISSSTHKLTYDQLYHAVAFYSKKICGGQFQDQKKIALFISDSIESYAVILSSIFNNLTYIPINTDDTPHRIRLLLEDCQADIIVYTRMEEEKLNQVLNLYPQNIKTLKIPLWGNTSYPNLELQCTERTEPIYVLYTSGSTGLPKGVAIAEENINNFLKWAGEYFQITQLDNFLSHPRITFDLSVFNIFLPLLYGARITIVDNFFDLNFPAKILNSGITMVIWTPRITNHLLETDSLPRNGYPDLRHVLFCGEYLPAKFVKAWQRLNSNIQLHNLYGPTEATVACTVYSFSQREKVQDPVPIGKAIPGNTLFIDNPKPTAPNMIEGEMVICGNQVSPYGYVRKNNTSFKPYKGYPYCFFTGDIVQKNSENLFFWKERRDEQIKVRGYRVELGEIEVALSNHPHLLDSCCLYNNQEQEIIFVFKTARKANEKPIIEELKVLSTNYFPPYMQPKHYIALPELPKNKHGKIDKQRIRNILSNKGIYKWKK